MSAEQFEELMRSTLARVEAYLAPRLREQRDRNRAVLKSFDRTARGLQQSFERRGA